MKKLLILIALLLTACVSAETPTATASPTPNPGEIALNMIQQQVAAEATSQVVELQIEATQQVIAATATEGQRVLYVQATEQARADAVSTAEQGRVNAAATQSRMDADAAATQARADVVSTAEQGRLDVMGTQSANATATFTVMTLTAIPPHATLTQMAVNNVMAMATQEVERSALSLKQARDTNTIQWAIPALAAIFILVAGALYFYNLSQVREIKDAEGDTKVFIYRNKQVIKPELFAKPMLLLETNEMPDLVDPKEQAEVTKRNQAIEALSVMPVAPAANAAAGFNGLFSGETKPRFEMLGNGELPPVELLNPETLKAIEGDWKESHD